MKHFPDHILANLTKSFSIFREGSKSKIKSGLKFVRQKLTESNIWVRPPKVLVFLRIFSHVRDTENLQKRFLQSYIINVYRQAIFQTFTTNNKTLCIKKTISPFKQVLMKMAVSKKSLHFYLLEEKIFWQVKYQMANSKLHSLFTAVNSVVSNQWLLPSNSLLVSQIPVQSRKGLNCATIRQMKTQFKHWQYLWPDMSNLYYDTAILIVSHHI